jgi:hypothetical protein
MLGAGRARDLSGESEPLAFAARHHAATAAKWILKQVIFSCFISG